MYHSVGPALSDWAWSELTTPAAVFESHLRALAKAGYEAITLAQLSDHVSGSKELRRKSVVLTFDDGYLDNWTHVLPLLERHGFRGTVVPTVEFVEPGDGVRPTLREAWQGAIDEGQIETRGFMSWGELRRGADTGLLDVQSHAFTHTWYPVGDEVVDFHHPDDAHYWLDWNAFPEDKPFYLSRLGRSRVPYGVPVYRHEKSLLCRRYYVDPAESDYCADLVARSGGLAFFEQPGWRDRLREEVARVRSTRGTRGRHETDHERTRRLQHEIVASKHTFEARLGRPVEYFVWPGGGYDAEALRIARQHYKAVTLSGAERALYRNRPLENPGSFVRRGAPTIKIGAAEHYVPGRYLVDFIEEFRGIPGARRRRQVRKLGYLTAASLGLWPR
jgi:peptidoglycan/xylan/chitin deacetylase (PgdA/CDA1 family)